MIEWQEKLDIMQENKWSEISKNIRQRLDLTQTDLAKLLGVSSPTVQRWEYSNTRPTPLQREVIVMLHQRVEKMSEKDANKAGDIMKFNVRIYGNLQCFYRLLKFLYEDE